MWSPSVLTVNSGWKTILLEMSRIWWMVKITSLLAYFFWLPHDSSCTISCMNKKGINSKTRNSMAFKLITSRCNEFICHILYILMFVPTLLPWFILSICAIERKSLMNTFKVQICQGQSFKIRSFLWTMHCILFLFNSWVDYQSKCWL